eukprot:1610415-Pleurochrysis_carterae.AAC.1
MLLNVSAVLPTFHTFFDEDGNRRTVNDPAAKVQMDYFYDVDVFVATVAPLVRVVCAAAAAPAASAAAACSDIDSWRVCRASCSFLKLATALRRLNKVLRGRFANAEEAPSSAPRCVSQRE